jgi:dihydrofolate synthase/folylpolyglutamate synthase
VRRLSPGHHMNSTVDPACLPQTSHASEATIAPSTLDEWLAYLEQVHPKSIAMGLDRVSKVKKALNLEPCFPIITVGGTNGKGSVSMMLEAILAAAGYRTACYTSPHLLRFNERVRVNAAPVDDGTLMTAFSRVEAARAMLPLTYFEFATLAAMAIFVDAEVDVAILEVGLGGRLDAVNVFDADCAVITSVDLDHMDYLGTTREAIGFEKAGIFRRGKAAICAESNVPESMRQYAGDIGTDFVVLGKDFGFGAERDHWQYWGYHGRKRGLPHPALRGAYQLRNAAAALAALDEVKERIPVAMNDIRRGLLQVELPGRFQVLPGRPAVVLDVAHNPHAAATLAENLEDMGYFERTIAVFAMLKDKDIAGVVQAVARRIDEWRVAGISTPRGASAEQLAEIIAGAAPSARVRKFESPGAAYLSTLKTARQDDRICVFGSFYTVGAILTERARRL